MPSPTRYFRSDTEIVSGTTFNKLLTSQTGSSQGKTAHRYLGIRYGKKAQDGTETEFDGTTVKAIVDTDALDGLYWETVSVSQQDLTATDRLWVRVYTSNDGLTGWALLGSWITEVLGAMRLVAATWTVYYYSDYFYQEVAKHLPDCEIVIIETETWTFRYDTVTYDSKITGLSYTLAAVKQPMGDGLVFVE
jgi:hypothetical protein